MPLASWHAPGNAKLDTALDAAARPHLNCYWLLPSLLLAGEHPAPHLPALLTSGVNHFIDLTSLDESLVDYRLTLPDLTTHQRFAITDYGVPTVPLMRQILGAVRVKLDARLPTYLHCHGGVGRTGTVVGCWWVEQGFTPDEALALLAEKWQVMEKRERAPHTPETPEQVAFIRAWPRR